MEKNSENLQENFEELYAKNMAHAHKDMPILAHKIHKMIKSNNPDLNTIRETLTPLEIVDYAVKFTQGYADHIDLPIANLRNWGEWDDLIFTYVCPNYRDVLVSGLFSSGGDDVGDFMENNICQNCGHRLDMALGECCEKKQFSERGRP